MNIYFDSTFNKINLLEDSEDEFLIDGLWFQLPSTCMANIKSAPEL